MDRHWCTCFDGPSMIEDKVVHDQMMKTLSKYVRDRLG